MTRSEYYNFLMEQDAFLNNFIIHLFRGVDGHQNGVTV